MYRSGELLEEVANNFAFLDDMSSVGGTIPRGRNSKPQQEQSSGPSSVKVQPWQDSSHGSQSSRGRSRLKYWEPKYHSVRDLPVYEKDRTVPKTQQSWEERRRIEEQLENKKQQEWEQDKLRRERNRRENERREIERSRIEMQKAKERANLDDIREAERAHKIERLRLEEHEKQQRLYNERRAREDNERQANWERQDDRDWALDRQRNVRFPDYSNEEPLDNDEKVRRWKVHPPQRLRPYGPSEEEVSNPHEIERIRTWEVHPPARDDQLDNWREIQESSPKRTQGVGMFFPPPKIPGDQSWQNSDFESSSTNGDISRSFLLNRTDQYLDAIDRMRRVQEIDYRSQNEIPHAPPPRKDHTVSSNATNAAVPAPPPPPPPPPMPTYEPAEPHQSTQLKQTNQNSNRGHVVPNLQDVQQARNTLRPVKATNSAREEPETFLDELNRLLLFQVAAQRWNIATPPVKEALMNSEKTETNTPSDIKTLSKVAMRNKLEVMYEKGPQKPSFRDDPEMKEKRKNVLAKKLNALENKVAADREAPEYAKGQLRPTPSGVGGAKKLVPVLAKFLPAENKSSENKSANNLQRKSSVVADNKTPFPVPVSNSKENAPRETRSNANGNNINRSAPNVLGNKETAPVLAKFDSPGNKPIPKAPEMIAINLHRNTSVVGANNKPVPVLKTFGASSGPNKNVPANIGRNSSVVREQTTATVPPDVRSPPIEIVAGDAITSRQRALMGGVLDTIKLRGGVTKSNFA